MTNEIVRMNPKTLPDAGKVGYSQISITNGGPIAFISGQVAWQVEGGVVPKDLAGQTAIVIKNLQASLTAINAKPENIVNMRIYMTDLSDENQGIAMPPLIGFLEGTQPCITGVGVSRLAADDLLIEIEMTVQLPIKA